MTYPPERTPTRGGVPYDPNAAVPPPEPHYPAPTQLDEPQVSHDPIDELTTPFTDINRAHSQPIRAGRSRPVPLWMIVFVGILLAGFLGLAIAATQISPPEATESEEETAAPPTTEEVQ